MEENIVDNVENKPKTTQKPKRKNLLKIVLIIAAVILIVQGVSFVKQAFDYKDNYYQSENFPSLNKHVYVGGDAYNYIINANYFTGYIVLGGSLFICGAVLISTTLLLNGKEKDK